MRKYLKKGLAILLTLLTAATALPGIAVAQESSDDPAGNVSALTAEENEFDSAGAAAVADGEDPAEAAESAGIQTPDAAENSVAAVSDPETGPEMYTGFIQENGAWQYYVNDVRSDLNSVVSGTINGTEGMWYVLNGKAQLDYTGLCDYADENGSWWYVTNGLADTGCNSVEQNDYGWWYVVGGRVDFA